MRALKAGISISSHTDSNEPTVSVFTSRSLLLSQCSTIRITRTRRSNRCSLGTDLGTWRMHSRMAHRSPGWLPTTLLPNSRLSWVMLRSTLSTERRQEKKTAPGPWVFCSTTEVVWLSQGLATSAPPPWPAGASFTWCTIRLDWHNSSNL
ncbi:unnamed protein product, partial [Ixodes persulcatus]